MFSFLDLYHCETLLSFHFSMLNLPRQHFSSESAGKRQSQRFECDGDDEPSGISCSANDRGRERDGVGERTGRRVAV